MPNVLEVEIQKHVATLWLNRPERRNALNEELMESLRTELEALENNPEIRLICLRGKGEKAFCAGADLQGTFSGSTPEEVNQKYAKLLFTLRNCAKVTLACVNGDCLGGGFGLALACDSILVKDTARVGTPEVKVGLFPMMISPLVIENFPQKYAMTMMLQGWLKPAKELFAPAPGVAEVIPSEQWEEKVSSFVEQFLRCSPLAQQHGKKALRSLSGVTTLETFSGMASHLHSLMQTADASEGLSAFLEKREPQWSGK